MLTLRMPMTPSERRADLGLAELGLGQRDGCFLHAQGGRRGVERLLADELLSNSSWLRCWVERASSRVGAGLFQLGSLRRGIERDEQRAPW